ncbi:uncharacterized protein [Panulirus ornatus]|uniref:uncharacterized protein n=1 Tax=Panulirus ornatus TaxID=150431 RepID=UPI003A861EBB
MRNFCLTVIFVICGLTLSTGDSTHLLRWAPLHLKSPYLTFLNQFYHPSWRTRHPITKEAESLRYLQLPMGVPFAVVCGACFQRSRVATNLTVSVTGHAYHSIPKRYSKRKANYRVGSSECLMTYMITAPIKTDGTVTCTLNRGTQTKTESISFGVADVPIEEPSEELEIRKDDEKVTLRCPTPEHVPSWSNPFVHVWHEEGDADELGSPIPEMTSTLSLHRPKNNRHITCSVYAIGEPSKVYRTRYQIAGSHAMAKQEYHVSYDLVSREEDQEPSPRMRLSKSVVGIIITAAVVCLLLVVIGIYRFTAAVPRQ